MKCCEYAPWPLHCFSEYSKYSLLPNIFVIVQLVPLNNPSPGRSSQNFLRSSYDHLMIILHSTYDQLVMIPIQFSYNHLTIVLSYDHEYQLPCLLIIVGLFYNHLKIHLQSSYMYIMIILWSPYNDLSCISWLLWWSTYNHLTIIIWSFYNHLMIILLSSYHDPLTIITKLYLMIILQSS